MLLLVEKFGSESFIGDFETISEGNELVINTHGVLFDFALFVERLHLFLFEALVILLIFFA